MHNTITISNDNKYKLQIVNFNSTVLTFSLTGHFRSFFLLSESLSLVSTPSLRPVLRGRSRVPPRVPRRSGPHRRSAGRCGTSHSSRCSHTDTRQASDRSRRWGNEWRRRRRRRDGDEQKDVSGKDGVSKNSNKTPSFSQNSSRFVSSSPTHKYRKCHQQPHVHITYPPPTARKFGSTRRKYDSYPGFQAYFTFFSFLEKANEKMKVSPVP